MGDLSELQAAVGRLQVELVLAIAPFLRWLDSRSWFTVKRWMMAIVDER